MDKSLGENFSRESGATQHLLFHNDFEREDRQKSEHTTRVESRSELTISMSGSMDLLGEGRAGPTRTHFTTRYLSIDVRKLARKSRLIANSHLQWVWKDQAGYVQGWVGIFVWTKAITLVYCMAGKPNETVEERICLTLSPNHGGGHRPWIVCPGCGRRVAILYFLETTFRCRN